jgi:hypothetical protein
MDTGPKISSGVLKRDIRYSKLRFSQNTSFSLRATKLLAVPGGPNKKMLSPAILHSNASERMCSFSYTPSLITLIKVVIRFFILYFYLKAK